MNPNSTIPDRTRIYESHVHSSPSNFVALVGAPHHAKSLCARNAAASTESARSGKGIQHALRRSLAPTSIPLTTSNSPTHLTSSNFITRCQKMKLAAAGHASLIAQRSFCPRRHSAWSLPAAAGISNSTLCSLCSRSLSRRRGGLLFNCRHSELALFLPSWLPQRPCPPIALPVPPRPESSVHCSADYHQHLRSIPISPSLASVSIGDPSAAKNHAFSPANTHATSKRR